MDHRLRSEGFSPSARLEQQDSAQLTKLQKIEKVGGLKNSLMCVRILEMSPTRKSAEMGSFSFQNAVCV